MIKYYLLITILAICFISCKKDSATENQPVNPVTITKPVVIESPATAAYIAVVNISGDTLKSKPVLITNN